MITETHPVIEALLDTTNIDDERKLLALNELVTLSQRNDIEPIEGAHDGEPAFSEDQEDIDELFLWEESELGVQFWSRIQDEVFTADKRSC